MSRLTQCRFPCSCPPPKFLATLAAFSLLFPASAFAEPTPAKPAVKPKPAPIRRSEAGTGLNVSLSWLPPASQAQTSALALLAKIAKRDAASFSIPEGAPNAQTPNLELNLPPFLLERQKKARGNPQTLATALAEHLLLAESLAQSPDEATRRIGLQAAFAATMQAIRRLPDPQIGARLLEGFVLPHLKDALDKPTADFPLTKQEILENACTAYRSSGEADKRLGSVAALVYVADNGGDAQGADWARINLAEDLAARKRFRDAITNLQAVTSPNLLGAKKWIAKLQQLEKDQKDTPKTEE